MSDPASVDKVVEIATKVGADIGKVKACMTSDAAAKFCNINS